MRNEITRMNWHRRLFGALIATLFLLAPSTVVWADNHGGGAPPPPPPGDGGGAPPGLRLLVTVAVLLRLRLLVMVADFGGAPPPPPPGDGGDGGFRWCSSASW